MKIPAPWHRLWLLLFLVGVAATGTALCYWQMQRTYSADIHARLQRAIVSIDVTLSHAELATKRATPLFGQPCNEHVLTALRTIVATEPYIRTINLLRDKDEDIYCTSVFGGLNSKVSLSDYTGGKLLLMENNDVSPYRSLMVYHSWVQNGNSAVVGIDGYYLHNILRMLTGESSLYLKVGNQWMTNEGNIISAPQIVSPVMLASTKYAYSAVADSEYHSGWRAFILHERGVLAIVLLFSGLLTFLFSRYLLYRATVESQLDRAIRNRQIVPYIQPIIDAATGRIAGGEILLRWRHPYIGFISPDTFITVAEQNGVIKEITRSCFYDVATQLQGVTTPNQDPLLICFNISASHFQDTQIVELSRNFIDRLPSSDFQLVLEITERELIGSTEQTAHTTELLKQAGVELSLDDFGTGNVNYNYIQQFAPEYLKIDKAFTRKVGNDALSTLVVESIISLAHKMGSRVVAEGIEEEEQKARLQQMGVSHFQGFLFYRPMPIIDFIRLLKAPPAAQ